MIAMRGVLRGLGHASEIFAERRPDSLAQELRLADSLPRHGDYVLIVHHSMGYTGFEHTRALPARKLLLYDNITPAAWLGHAPGLQHNAVLGRAQLAQWRGHVAVCLAPSEYNATELRRPGLGAVRACCLLFDLAALRRRAEAAAIPRDSAIFALLFVGRITASKAQDDLFAAYQSFPARFNRPSRLVLAGGFDPEDYAYLDRLNALILENRLFDRVLLTGKISDTALDAWYARADLYVSLSHHEGFGVPLV